MHIIHKKQSCYKIEGATLIMKCIAPAYTYHIQKAVIVKPQRLRLRHQEPGQLVLLCLTPMGTQSTDFYLKMLRIFMTAFHTLSLLYFSLLHFPSVRSTPAFSTPEFSAPPRDRLYERPANSSNGPSLVQSP